MEISTLGSHQMSHAGVVAHPSSRTPTACELEKFSSSEERQGEPRREVMFRNFLMGGKSHGVVYLHGRSCSLLMCAVCWCGAVMWFVSCRSRR